MHCSVEDKHVHPEAMQDAVGFGGLVVSMLASVPKIAVSNQAEAVGFFRA
jgi:hypothetical protein